MILGKTHIAAVAMRKCDAPPGWIIVHAETIGESDDWLIQGCIPGHYKNGKPRYDEAHSTHFREVCVTDSEEREEAARYESETAKCGRCFGEGKIVCGWSREAGTRYNPCPRCGATGAAPKIK
jgi:hypothetical protein